MVFWSLTRSVIPPSDSLPLPKVVTPSPGFEPKPEPKVYICPICHWHFKNKDKLTGHLMKHKSDDPTPFKCHLCPESFGKNTELNIHLGNSHPEDYALTTLPTKFGTMTHTARPLKHTCPHCPQKFTNQSICQAHIKSTHPDAKRSKPFTCLRCGKKFARKKDVVRHQKSSICAKKIEKRASSSYKCETCDISYKNKCTLDTHNREVHEIFLRAYKHTCLFCGYYARSPSDLDAHNEKHTSGDYFNCRTCGKAFRFKKTFKGHGEICRGRAGAEKNEKNERLGQGKVKGKNNVKGQSKVKDKVTGQGESTGQSKAKGRRKVAGQNSNVTDNSKIRGQKTDTKKSKEAGQDKLLTGQNKVKGKSKGTRQDKLLSGQNKVKGKSKDAGQNKVKGQSKGTGQIKVKGRSKWPIKATGPNEVKGQSKATGPTKIARQNKANGQSTSTGQDKVMGQNIIEGEIVIKQENDIEGHVDVGVILNQQMPGQDSASIKTEIKCKQELY